MSPLDAMVQFGPQAQMWWLDRTVIVNREKWQFDQLVPQAQLSGGDYEGMRATLWKKTLQRGRFWTQSLNIWAEGQWMFLDGRSFKDGRAVCKEMGIWKTWPMEQLKEWHVSKLRYRQGLLATTVSLHSLSYSFCIREIWRMSAVKIGSRCIIKSIMLPLKPGPCFHRNP